MTSSPCIELVKVNKGYTEAGRRRIVLKSVNATFARARIIVIRGRSGSGKSTLLNLLGGIDLPDSGDIAINGQVINQLGEEARTLVRRRHIGFVFQFFNLVPTLTVAENLAFPLELNGVSKNEIRPLITSLLDEFSLQERMDAFPEQLSGGEQQRIAIARAVVHRPAVLLADEPTGNLDQETEGEVLKVLKSLPANHGVTVICATHSAEVADIADEVYQLKDGILTGS